MSLAQGPQHSDAGEAPTHSPLVSSQALYHWATALPTQLISLFRLRNWAWVRTFSKFKLSKFPTFYIVQPGVDIGGQQWELKYLKAYVGA